METGKRRRPHNSSPSLCLFLHAHEQSSIITMMMMMMFIVIAIVAIIIMMIVRAFILDNMCYCV